MYNIIFFSIIGTYLAVYIIWFLIKRKSIAKFHHLINYWRKVLYGIFCSCLLVGLARKDLLISNWTVLLIYLGVVVIIDLTVFQTPTVTKLANAEFVNNDITEQMSDAILKGQKEFNLIKGRNELLLNIVQESEVYFCDKGTIQNWKHYKYLVKEYLDEYLNYTDINVRVNQFVNGENEDEKFANINLLCKKILNSNGESIENEKLNDITTQLIRGDVYKVNENLYILPIYGKRYNMLIVITGKEILPIDIINITCMINFFEWFLV